MLKFRRRREIGTLTPNPSPRGRGESPLTPDIASGRGEKSASASIDAALRAVAARFAFSATPMLDARVLMMAALGCNEAQLIADGARKLTDDESVRFDAIVARRSRHEPVAHIVGRREFRSLDIAVEPGILVPRTDSETLIDAIVARRKSAGRVLDLGCGSGALLCALLAAYPEAQGLGVDIDPHAVALTNRNLANLGFSARGRAALGDWLSGVEGAFDVIVANPPYIRDRDRDGLSREVRDYEAERALFAGADGLDAHRVILAGASKSLAAGGLMAVEFGQGQTAGVKELARSAFSRAALTIENDLGGRPRALVIDLSSGAH